MVAFGTSPNRQHNAERNHRPSAAVQFESRSQVVYEVQKPRPARHVLEAFPSQLGRRVSFSRKYQPKPRSVLCSIMICEWVGNLVVPLLGNRLYNTKGPCVVGATLSSFKLTLLKVAEPNGILTVCRRALCPIYERRSYRRHADFANRR